MAAGQQWYYVKNQQKYGPVSAAELQSLVRSGKLGSRDLIWTDQWPDWRAVATVPGLLASAAPAPSGPPPLPSRSAKVSASSRPDDVEHGEGRRPPSTMSIVIGALAGGIVLTVLACCGIAALFDPADFAPPAPRAVVDDPPVRGFSDPESDAGRVNVMTEPAIQITPRQLFAEYEANDVAADRKYKGKVLQMTGTVDSISRDILDTIYVTLQAGNATFFRIQCFFDDSSEEAVAKLSSGQSLTIRGRCDGKFGNVMLKDCAIVK